jgi:Protein of unknown function VcgC/VcgE (DUF2780)
MRSSHRPLKCSAALRWADPGALKPIVNELPLVMELVQLLVQQLGINNQQASGGLGLMMNVAKEKLGGDFGQVAQLLPGIDDVMKSAPKPEGLGAAARGGLGSAFGAVSGLLGGKAGGALGQLGNLAALTSGFKQLGLDSSKIGQFIPVILGFLQNKGGAPMKQLLERALR